TDIKPIVYEASNSLGDLSKTADYKDNLIDIGGHRYFSKFDRVMDWWLNILPIEDCGSNAFEITYQNKKRTVYAEGGLNPDQTDAVMFVRSRKSRIYFNRRLFDYPISLSAATFLKLGLYKSFRIGISYMGSAIQSTKPNEH
ncbi:unnamed protein product, partial [marine sediment metagenome]